MQITNATANQFAFVDIFSVRPSPALVETQIGYRRVFAANVLGQSAIANWAFSVVDVQPPGGTLDIPGRGQACGRYVDRSRRHSVGKLDECSPPARYIDGCRHQQVVAPLPGRGARGDSRRYTAIVCCHQPDAVVRHFGLKPDRGGGRCELRHVRRVKGERPAFECDVMHRAIAGRISHHATDAVPYPLKAQTNAKRLLPGLLHLCHPFAIDEWSGGGRWSVIRDRSCWSKQEVAGDRAGDDKERDREAQAAGEASAALRLNSR